MVMERIGSFGNRSLSFRIAQGFIIRKAASRLIHNRGDGLGRYPKHIFKRQLLRT